MFSCASHDIELLTDQSGERRKLETVRSNRWAVILAGGDGTRLRSLTRRIAGDERPKQFCAIFGGETLLDQTRRRVALSVPSHRTMMLLTRTHERFYDSLVRGTASRHLVVQPSNRGTAPAILYGLMRLDALDPDATVAFFPSDHYFSDDEMFASCVNAAFRAVDVRPEKIVLLGIKPNAPETSYGWIEPVASVLNSWPGAVSEVQRFWEKPAHAVARSLMMRGCLWNSFVMVGRVRAFLEIIRKASGELHDDFKAIRQSLNTPDEQRVVRSLYEHLAEVNFSHQVLAARPSDLSVLAVSTDVGWSDWGEPERVMTTLAHIGANIAWAA